MNTTQSGGVWVWMNSINGRGSGIWVWKNSINGRGGGIWVWINSIMMEEVRSRSVGKV